MKLCSLALALLALSVAHAFRKQSYRIKVKLICGDKPDTGAKVKLVDKDTGPDPDDTLEEGRTNSQGYIELGGATREMTTIDPILEIKTNCDDGLKPCYRKWKFELPDSYINTKKVFDVGTINTMMRLKDEDRDCIN